MAAIASAPTTEVTKVPVLTEAEKTKLRQLEKTIRESVPNTEALDIPLQDICVKLDENVRQQASYDDAEIQNLADAIEGVGGLLQPIGVTEVTPSAETEGKSYALIYGFRRMLALLKLQEKSPDEWQTVRCLSYKINSAAVYKIIQMAENSNRKDLNPIETANGLQQILDADKSMTQKAAAKLLGIPESTASHYKKLLSFPAKIQEQISSGELQMAAAKLIAYEVPEKQWAEAVVSAIALPYPQFEKKMKTLYGKSVGDSETGDKADSTEVAGPKGPKLIRSAVLNTRYLPFLKEKAAKASTEKAFSQKDLIEAEIMAIEACLLTENNPLNEEIKPFLEKAAKQEEVEKENEKAGKERSKWVVTLVKKAVTLLNDFDVSNPNAVRKTPAEAYGMVAADVSKMDDAAIKALGFPLDVKAADFKSKLAIEIYEAHKVAIADQKKRKDEKAKKDAEEKAKAEAEAAQKAKEGETAAAGK